MKNLRALTKRTKTAWRGARRYFVLPRERGSRNPFLRFLRSESGMTLPLLVISMTAMLGFTGIAIDTARMQMVQSKLQFSLDAAGLAAGSTVSTTSLNSETAKYLNSNFNGYMGATLTGSSVTADSTNTNFNLSATATLPTTFMGVVGVKQITVTANSHISRAVTGLELVMVLDNTGSMSQSAGGSVSKIQALQTASKTLVNTLFGGATTSTNGKLWVGIVPFSQAVNIGTSHPTWINANYTYDGTTTPLDWGPSGSWGGCVDARQNGEDITDDPPSQTTASTLFGQYYWTSDNLNTDGIGNAAYNNWKTIASYQKCVTTYKRCKGASCSNVSPTCSATNGYSCVQIADTCTTVASCTVNSTTKCTPNYTYASPLNTTNKGPNLLCSQQVTPMTNNATTLTNAITSMSAQGDTLINQGLEWGWNMLSPRWRGQWGGTMDANSLPLDYNTQGMAKAIVLVTDGENTIDNTSHGAYWFLGSGLTGSTSSSTAVSKLDSKTLALCTAMKNQGIYIYTIGLGTSGGINTAELQSCATAVNYYFASPTTSQLSTIFSAIGDSLSNLRVSQ
ncbi:MAG: pilus assembly protein TadG-related protein [Alphaproteobacteria bacterium]|nr:pilus assembly protein TadG-related protein [Alphaproteobacteria bacterium]